MKYLSYLLCFLGVSLSMVQAQTKVFPFQANYLWGIMDEGGEVLLEPTYFRMNFFLNYDQEDAVAVINQEGYYGLIDRKGEEVIPPRYNGVDFLPGGKAVTIKAGRNFGLYNLVDREGILSPYYQKFKVLDEAGALIWAKKKDSTAVYRFDGKAVVPLAVSQKVTMLNPEAVCPVMKVEQGEESSYVDCKGKKVKEKDVPPATQIASVSSKDGSAQASLMLSASGQVDPKLSEFKEQIWEKLGYEVKVVEVYGFPEEKYYGIVVKDRKYGLCDGQAQMVLPFTYQRINRSQFGYQFHQDGLFGLYDPEQARIILPANFSHISDPYKTYGKMEDAKAYYFVVTGDKKGGYVDKKSGKLYLPKE